MHNHNPPADCDASNLARYVVDEAYLTPQENSHTNIYQL